MREETDSKKYMLESNLNEMKIRSTTEKDKSKLPYLC